MIAFIWNCVLWFYSTLVGVKCVWNVWQLWHFTSPRAFLAHVSDSSSSDCRFALVMNSKVIYLDLGWWLDSTYLNHLIKSWMIMYIFQYLLAIYRNYCWRKSVYYSRSITALIASSLWGIVRHQFLLVLRFESDANSQHYLRANQSCPFLRSNDWAINAALNPSQSCGWANLTISHVWGSSHLSQGFGTFHWLVHNPLKVTATNYTTLKQTDAYPELGCGLIHQTNISGLCTHHLNGLNNMCVTHVLPEWPHVLTRWGKPRPAGSQLLDWLFCFFWTAICHRASLVWLSFSQAATSLSRRPISPPASS